MVLASVNDFMYRIGQEKERHFNDVNFHDGNRSFRAFNLAPITDIVKLLTDRI